MPLHDRFDFGDVRRGRVLGREELPRRERSRVAKQCHVLRRERRRSGGGVELDRVGGAGLEQRADARVLLHCLDCVIDKQHVPVRSICVLSVDSEVLAENTTIYPKSITTVAASIRTNGFPTTAVDK